jgi:hypothetical protein
MGAISVYPGSILNWDSGNIETDPCFASFDPNGDPNGWDLHLKSAYGRWDQQVQNWVIDSNTSLCVDAGDPNTDWSVELWPNGKRVNIGGFGASAQASKNGNVADFDVNGTVDFVDFGQIAEKWKIEQESYEDVTNNGIVDFGDLKIFVENWLWQRQ